MENEEENIPETKKLHLVFGFSRALAKCLPLSVSVSGDLSKTRHLLGWATFAYVAGTIRGYSVPSAVGIPLSRSPQLLWASVAAFSTAFPNVRLSPSLRPPSPLSSLYPLAPQWVPQREVRS